jgi:hypothetical protein
MSTTLAMLVAIHLGEGLIWTVPIYLLGVIPGFRDAYSYALEA